VRGGGARWGSRSAALLPPSAERQGRRRRGGGARDSRRPPSRGRRLHGSDEARPPHPRPRAPRRGPTSTYLARRSSFLSGGPRAKDDGDGDDVKDEKRRRRAKDDGDDAERPSSGGGGFPRRRELLPLSPWCAPASPPRLPPSLSLSPTAGHTGRLSAPSDVACAVRPPNAPGMEAAGPNGMVRSPFQVAGAGVKTGKATSRSLSWAVPGPGADSLSDVPVDDEAPVVTSRISRSAGAQYFGGAHRGRFCVRVFIAVSVRACCEHLRCIVST
jgi:hypothetical protein